MKNVVMAFVIVALTGISGLAKADSHALIQSMRSSQTNYLLISQSVEAEAGAVTTAVNAASLGNENATGTIQRTNYWQGYNFRTAFGLELMKFIQFGFGHTFVNSHRVGNSFESLRGSRLHGDLNLAFSSPIGNLEAGLGITGSKLDYQRQLENETLFGSGFYYSLGVNYFLSSRTSLFGHVKLNTEHLVKNGGTGDVPSIDTNLTSVGIGFRLWM